MNGYIKNLDGLRAIAIILVMTFHAGITHFGWMGVQLFFVLSGFLITGILWNEKKTDTSISYKLKKFWVRRSLRIFPLYWTYLLAIFLIYLAFHIPAEYYTYFPYLFSYTFNFTRSSPGWVGDPFYTHLWSLCIEEQFYLVFPLIIYFCSSGFIKYMMPVVILLAPVIRFFLCEYYTSKGLPTDIISTSIYWNTFSHLDAFFAGGIIHVLSLKKFIKKPGLLFVTLLIIALAAGLWNFTHSEAGSFYFNDLGYNNAFIANYEHVWHYSILNILFASFILFLVSPYTQTTFLKLRWFLESKWMVNIGKVSYGMYVFHWSILYYVYEKIFHSDIIIFKILLFIPYVLLVYFLASISFRYFESRFIVLKDRFFNNNDNVKTGELSSNRIP